MASGTTINDTPCSSLGCTCALREGPSAVGSSGPAPAAPLGHQAEVPRSVHAKLNPPLRIRCTIVGARVTTDSPRGRKTRGKPDRPANPRPLQRSAVVKPHHREATVATPLRENAGSGPVGHDTPPQGP